MYYLVSKILIVIVNYLKLTSFEYLSGDYLFILLFIFRKLGLTLLFEGIFMWLVRLLGVVGGLLLVKLVKIIVQDSWDCFKEGPGNIILQR